MMDKTFVAGVFKSAKPRTGMFCQFACDSMLVMVLLFASSLCYTDNKIIRRTPNLKNLFYQYENVTVDLILPTNSRGKITFQTKNDLFIGYINLHNLVDKYLDKLDVNGLENNLETDTENHRVYEGTLTRPFDAKLFLKVDLEERELDATMLTRKGSYVLEASSRYFNQSQDAKADQPGQFQTIFYRHSDVNLKNIIKNHTTPRLNNVKTQYPYPVNEPRRTKRQTRSKTECFLHIHCDHTFFDSQGGGKVAKTISTMLFYVAEADQIFRWTDFDGDGAGDNIGFHVAKITIYNGNKPYKMEGITDISDYLEAFAEYNFNDYCLATVFTSIDFEETLGLAWVASSSPYGAAGGICQRRITFNGKDVSFNANIVTDLSFGERMPNFAVSLTLAHEIGHNFGSPHDPQNDVYCTPNNEYGNFIMYPYSTPGDKPNNYLFSSCSINYIYPVIQTKSYCFQYRQEATCGNGAVETGEECDCGNSIICNQLDKCCTPSDVAINDFDRPCTYRRSKMKLCSPQSSVCCTDDCEYVARSENITCAIGTDCTAPSYCNGTTEICPITQYLPEATPCRYGRRSCVQGKCVGSICLSYDLEECMCIGDHGCHVCCEGANRTCSPLLNEEDELVYRNPGDLCNERQGFCNREGECMELDIESTVDRIFELFTEETAITFQEWVKLNWFYVASFVGLFVVVLTIFIVTYKKGTTVQINAFMYGRFLRIRREAEFQKEYLLRRRTEAEKLHKDKLKRYQLGSLQRSLPQAVARLSVFFPTVDRKVLIHTVKSSSTEAMSVRWLLMKNYPFRRFYEEPEKEEDEESDDDDEAFRRMSVNYDVLKMKRTYTTTGMYKNKI